MTVIARAAGYAALFYTSLAAARHWFDGAEMAALSLFTLGSFVVEMVRPRVLREACAPAATGLLSAPGPQRAAARSAIYLAAVVGMAVSGFGILHHGMHVRQAEVMRQAIERRMVEPFNASDQTVVLVTNDDQVVVAISGALLRKIGYDRAEVLRRPVTDLIPAFDLAQARADMAAVRGADHPGWVVRENRRVEFRAKAGGTVGVEMTLIARRIAVDAGVERDVLFLMLAEEGP